MEHHFCPGYNLEQILDTIDDPAERAHIIDEAYQALAKPAVASEAVIVETPDAA